MSLGIKINLALTYNAVGVKIKHAFLLNDCSLNPLGETVEMNSAFLLFAVADIGYLSELHSLEAYFAVDNFFFFEIIFSLEGGFALEWAVSFPHYMFGI